MYIFDNLLQLANRAIDLAGMYLKVLLKLLTFIMGVYCSFFQKFNLIIYDSLLSPYF